MVHLRRDSFGEGFSGIKIAITIIIQDMIRRNVLITLGEVEGIHLFGEHVHAEPTTNQLIPAEPL